MSDIFISYARSTEAKAKQIAAALQQLGYSVWRDDELPAHKDYSAVIEQRLRGAKAVLVVWSADATKSRWVCAEADVAHEAGTLVQLSLDGVVPPLPFNRVQCADLGGWNGEADAPGWRKIVASVAELLGQAGVMPAPTETPPSPLLPSKPSIAVLPFANLTGGKDEDYFSDGMVVEIVTALSRFPSLFVIASSSSLTFRETAGKTAQIARELGVRYLLEGNVRKGGERVRIGVQLIDTATSEQIWTERFDGLLEDVFALQDNVANAVAGQIEPTIQAAELRRANARPTSDQDAYDLYLRAAPIFRRWDRDSFKQVMGLMDQAVISDPGYAMALTLSAACRAHAISLGWTDQPEADRTIALDHRARALRIAPDDPEVIGYLVLPSLILGIDKSICRAMAVRAVAQNPGSAFAWLNVGWINVLGDQPEVGLGQLETGLRLDPRSGWRPLYLDGIGFALMFLHRFEEAIPVLKETADLLPELTPILMNYVAVCHAHLGRLDEARAVLAAHPPATFLESILGWMEPRERELVRSGMALAGGAA